MEVAEGTCSEDLWSPYKELVNVVENYLAREGEAPYAVQTFESVLRRHKQTFLSLMKYPTKNISSREEIKRGMSEGVILPSVGKTLLSKELVDEAIIISDMWDVNEYLALELLHTAQRQAPRNPGLPRGLVAVLLYYDGRKAIATALKELVMAREGVSWCISAREELVTYVSRYVDNLIADGLLERVMDTLKTTDLASELELLHNNRALGGPKHYRQVMDTFESIRKQLAGVMFAASAQKGLSADALMRVYKHLHQTPLVTGPTGDIDDVSLALHMALLYSIDLSVLHRRSDGEELVKKLLLYQDPDLLAALITEFTPQPQSGQVMPNQGHPHQSGVLALCQLSLGLALAALKRAPQSLLRRNGNPIRPDLLDQDEVMVDAAIEGRVFDYIHEVLLSNKNSLKEEFYARRLHSLITDFIALMHSKLMEMRIKADEAARAVQMYAAEGLNPPPSTMESHRSQFEALLKCIEKLYENETLGLKEDYWSAADQQHIHSYGSGGRAATLYKFVRLSGELVGARLLAPYVRCVAALAVPVHTYALLARNEMAPHTPLSWDHIFSALYSYLCNLRCEPLPLPEQHHISSMGASAITSHSNRAKMLVREDEIKALIATLKLVQAVAKVDSHASTAICENLRWDAINCMFGLLSCHIPLTVKAELALALAALGSGPCALRVWAGFEATKLIPQTESLAHGLHSDLAEVETRQEEYPLTRAVLQLLISLSRAAQLPLALGAGTRPAGLDPYLLHVLRRVLLPAAARPYARQGERWQIFSMSLELLTLWLEKYEPQAFDFPLTNKSSETNPPPGLHIMLQLHTRSELLRLLLQLLAEIVNTLEQYKPVPGKEHMEDTLVYCLSLLEVGLAKEKAFISEATTANCTIPISGLSKLLLGSEVAIGVEPLLVCCRVLCASAPSGGASRASVLLLQRALTHPNAHTHLLAVIHATHRSRLEIRHGFVECLDVEDWNGSENIRATKEGIVNLMQRCLRSGNQNLTHYLCGITGDITILEPGVHDAPRTALFSLLTLLEASKNMQECTTLTESIYCLLYWLCARPFSSRAVLRLLRGKDNFLLRHLQTLVPLDKSSVTTISARSWCVRAAACELASTAPTLTPLAQTLTQTQDWEWCLVRRLISGLPLEVEPVVEPVWELFHAPQLRKAISLCDLPIPGGGKRISVSKVHEALVQELSALNPTAPQRNMVAAEIQKVLDYCTEINMQRNLASTLTHYYDSWRQLTEILFCVAPVDVLNADSRRILLLNILQDLLEKISPEKVVPHLGNLASGTLLLLLVNLRHCYVLQKKEGGPKLADSEFSLFETTGKSVRASSLGLKFILEKTISWLLIPGGTTQKMRINLYGALLNILNVANEKSSDDEKDIGYVSRLDSSVVRNSRAESSIVEAISNVSNELCNAVCSDCVEGTHPLCRMVALCCMDALLQLHPHGRWPAALADRGYLDNLIASLLQDDEELRHVLDPTPRSLKALYIYESKMTLLTKIASTRGGAELVLEQNALSCLANLKALDCRPDCSGLASQGTDFIPPVSERFKQLLIPALAFCDALLSTLGTDNHSLVLQITHFLFSHMETIDMILRAAHPSSPQGTLVEIEAITSVISRTADRDVLAETDTNSPGLNRLETLMLALLPRFANYARPVDFDDNSPELYFKIVCNLITYLRHIASATSGHALLRPTLAPQHTPTLGAVIQMLQTLVRGCHERAKALSTIQTHLRAVPTLTHQELKNLLPQSQLELSPLESRLAAAEALARRSRLRRRDLAQAAHACEATAHALWLHLRAYFAHHHVNKGPVLLPLQALTKSYETDLVDLKKGLISIFNDKFASELLEISKHIPESQRGLMDVLLLDIKSLIQFTPV